MLQNGTALQNGTVTERYIVIKWYKLQKDIYNTVQLSRLATGTRGQTIFLSKYHLSALVGAVRSTLPPPPKSTPSFFKHKTIRNVQ
jgi:hypothetical protein